ncbi:transmembrane protein 209-like isoform X2 [Pomacea canaliculata]|uniref:transmembrane protein 209-like isoform X2 n=1 Tax=Pomacea canaliculata TaxID=400727 RepID=UPI000D7321B7|nr:transmembrane protein 209-like isoform X2 [Pomacea canaliculata]
MKSFEQSTTPVVDATWQQRRQLMVARRALLSSALIVVFLLLIYFDINSKVVSSWSGFDYHLWFLFEVCLGLLLMIKISLNVFILIGYLWTFVFGRPVDLTEQQRILLGVQESEHGFRTPPQQQSPVRQSPENRLIFSTPHGSFSSGEGSPHNLMRPLSFSPGFMSTSSPYTTRYRSPYFSSPSSYGTPRNHSFDGNYQSFSTSASSEPVSFYSGGNSSTRSHLAYAKRYSPSDVNKLKSFLQGEEEKELRCKQSTLDNLNTSSSFWSFGASALDLTYTLRKYAYQLATPSPQTTTKATAADQTSLSGFDEVWNSYGVTEDALYTWIEKLRKWLSSTIVSRLSRKIVEINKQLQKIGCEDMQIGEIGLATVKQLALSKGSMVPSLNKVVPYLECCPNQEYLVHRILDLSTGSMSEYTWNKGGNYGKPWGEHLITDAALVMHLLCTYLDSRLPAQPRYMDGRVFTAQHFVKTPEKPDMQRKENLLIYQTSINPPHFQVVIGTETFNLPKGRNNLFQAILLFFYHIKTREGGMLGRVNLGMSGLNILWIFD